MIKHQLPARYPIPDKFTKGEAEFTLLDRMGNVAVYRRQVGKHVTYATFVAKDDGGLPSVEGSSVRALSAALERLDALYAASIGNPLYRSVSS